MNKLILCGNCVWCVPAQVLKDRKYECHANPPRTMHGKGGVPIAYWPPVLAQKPGCSHGEQRP